MTFACSYGWYVYLYSVCIFTFNSLWGEGNFGALLSFHNHVAMTFAHRHGRYLYLYLVCIWFVFAFVLCIHPLVPCYLCITVKQWLLPVGMVGLGLFCNNTLTDTPGKPCHCNNKAIGSNPPPPPPLGSISVCLPRRLLYMYIVFFTAWLYFACITAHISDCVNCIVSEIGWDTVIRSWPRLVCKPLTPLLPASPIALHAIQIRIRTKYKYTYMQNINACTYKYKVYANHWLHCCQHLPIALHAIQIRIRKNTNTHTQNWNTYIQTQTQIQLQILVLHIKLLITDATYHPACTMFILNSSVLQY